ncbi:MAG: AAA family ATPase, partial [Caenispirillum bisanense]|nr:AAA family ATPase [Caenispirillum bisanense]
MGVTRLTLTDFRAYGHLRLDVDLRPVVLTGHNGAGKTNLLEALSFLSPGRGLRRAKLSEVTRRDAEGAPFAGWAVAA